MVPQFVKITMIATALLAGASSSAFADCEADLNQLEAAMKAPGVKPDQLKAFENAGAKASSALRKDDDATCHQIISDALTAAGGKLDAAASTGAGLGDLSAFKTITDDTLALVKKADMAGAKTRIKDLETAWDQAQDTLRAKDPAAWDNLDQAIDAALTSVRAGAPDAKASADALTALDAAFSK
ncbi:hypothetical protein [Aestuariivirga litoralis]|uniref:hypothetical protein n=1 Tax=Aestuariivirga litoralis TaxID=2650924 RepID=UPI001FEF1777|nr:hypothetical protein [Aestuariivirga litoralis]MBG1233883.1 hypothetical protein [Aestuariivirga litoralis]